MPFARKDDEGKITELCGSRSGDAEEVSSDDPEVLRFLAGGAASEDLKQQLSSTDHELVRVLEDLIDVLVDRGVILYTDLPEAAQRKLVQRRKLRQGLQSEPPLISRENKIL